MTPPQQNICLLESSWYSISGAHRFSHQAMATTFEIFILYNDAHYASQAAFAAFAELDRLEAELSRFIENSDISRINNLGVNQPLLIGADAFECLQLCAYMYNETSGAFDITIGLLYDCWLDEDKAKRSPSKEQLNQASRRTGSFLFELDQTEHTAQVLTDSVKIDLGGIGKGYAIDRMASLLHEWSIDTALIHAGYSSVLALGSPPAAKGWPVTISDPGNRKKTLARLDLHNRAISGSGLQKGRHIIDPRSACPAEGKLAAWACAPDAAAADALSTAFMVMSPNEIEQYCLSHPDTLAVVVVKEQEAKAQKDNILHLGPWEKDELIK